MTIEQEKLLQLITQDVKNIFIKDSSGHDWWHIFRVTKTAKNISKQEGGDNFIVELSALLHDVGDYKLFVGNNNTPDVLIKKMLNKYSCSNEITTKVINVVKQVSYKGANVNTTPTSLEAKIVQDADRIDAIGAIGIARAFAFGGYKNRLIYNPNQKPILHNNFESYKNNKSHTINHFYEKLLLLKDRMQTKTGKKIAEERHEFMEMYLKQFYKEWEGA